MERDLEKAENGIGSGRARKSLRQASIAGMRSCGWTTFRYVHKYF
jgi:hypothetical protein